MEHYHFIEQTPSTNVLLRNLLREGLVAEGTIVHTDFQTEGKGQIGNTWESADGENLLFSTVLFPKNLLPENQFLVSQLVSIAVVDALEQYASDFTVKWPNDIYWKDKKIAGILIENSLQGKQIKYVIIGIGLNVNQALFESNAPNPVSLKQITGDGYDIKALLQNIHSNILNIYTHINSQKVRNRYADILYRKEGFHSFEDGNGLFEARIVGIASDGRLDLETRDGEPKSYYFKEVRFI